MSIAVGTRLGNYEVTGPLGAGGMGEVYRAQDTRLRREVAIKVASVHFTERFDREARAIASLNHPNICTLYDVGPNYLVMELVEGPTLAERIKEGALPLEEALNVARQIADALDAAHEKGITHRDLKPGNVKIKPDGTVKVLDFGLAKVGGAAAASSADSPTLTMHQTEAGVILGTAAYMSPEQARGKNVDKRADIWAFGVVLYEMLAGKRPFRGEDVSELLASVIKEEPHWDAIPPQVRRLLQRCLEKDPQKRLRHIGDVMLLVEDAPPLASHVQPEAAARRRPWLAWGAAALFFALAASALPIVVAHFRETAPEPIRFEVPPPANNKFDIYLGLSPDGRRLAFTALGTDGVQRIWVRGLDTLEAQPLTGTEGAGSIIWSPDSRFIAFGAGNQVKKIDVSGGPPQTLCQSATAVGSGSWSKTGVIVFGGRGTGALQQVSEAGGTASPVTALDGSHQEAYHSFPSFLPDGRHFIYYRSAGSEYQGIYLGSLDSQPGEQSPTRLLAAGFGGVYASSPDGSTGRILFLREGTLMAQPFGVKNFALAGQAVPVAERVGNTNQYANISASANGVLAYRPGGGGNTQFTWFDREGKNLGPAGEPERYFSLALSPDAKNAVVRRQGDLWLLEFARGVSTRFTFAPHVSDDPVWSPDGSRIVFDSNRNGGYDLYRKASNGAGEDEILLQSGQNKYPTSWSRDGRFLLYNSTDPKTQDDIWVLPLDGQQGAPGKPFSFLRTEFNEGGGAFSPDGLWISYVSTESGGIQVYVRPFAPPGPGASASAGAAAGKWQVSKNDVFSAVPLWRADGKELYYRTLSGTLMAVEVSTNPTFQAGSPRRLFDAPGGALIDATADGKKFLVGMPQQDTGPSAITVALNWQSGLKK